MEKTKYRKTEIITLRLTKPTKDLIDTTIIPLLKSENGIKNISEYINYLISEDIKKRI